ncbi:MAG: cellulase family glycosylhydrolase [Oscillospiraceae bacterium]|nr:cellulase family glycosylhydrolase [Oscillospiraceae bacterium]
MLKESGFYKGINLGGWLSQCDYSEDRLNSFITEKDFAVIASWGFDHVRLPVDYNVIQDAQGSMIEEGLARVDAALECCEKNGLHMVLDLHKTPGFSFDPQEKELGFFRSEADQQRFYSIWECFAARYADRSELLMFDLLNEITEPSYLEDWIRISAECIRRIRCFAPDVRILIGSYHHNAVSAVKDLPAPADDRVFYSFHCYDPHTYTHQGAYWMSGVEGFDVDARVSFRDTGVTPAFFEELFASAFEKAQAEGTELYCGEYGVIDIVPPEDALGWFRTIHEVFEKYGIARSVWTYREMDFGLADTRMDTVRKELLSCL